MATCAVFSFLDRFAAIAGRKTTAMLVKARGKPEGLRGLGHCYIIFGNYLCSFVIATMPSLVLVMQQFIGLQVGAVFACVKARTVLKKTMSRGCNLMQRRSAVGQNHARAALHFKYAI
jgi:hypothetical protein